MTTRSLTDAPPARQSNHARFTPFENGVTVGNARILESANTADNRYERLYRAHFLCCGAIATMSHDSLRQRERGRIVRCRCCPPVARRERPVTPALPWGLPTVQDAGYARLLLAWELAVFPHLRGRS